MRQAFTNLISFGSLITPALAQAAPAAGGGEFPWLWLIVALVALAGGIWWYMNRIRGRP
jgi:hypothetical protein